MVWWCVVCIDWLELAQSLLPADFTYGTLLTHLSGACTHPLLSNWTSTFVVQTEPFHVGYRVGRARLPKGRNVSEVCVELMEGVGTDLVADVVWAHWAQFAPTQTLALRVCRMFGTC